MSDFAPPESHPNKITRRDFLKTTAAGIAGLWFKPEFSFTLPPSPEWSIKLRNEWLALPENRAQAIDYIRSVQAMDINARFALPLKKIPPEFTKPNPGISGNFDQVPELISARKILPSSERISTIIGLLGNQTAEQVAFTINIYSSITKKPS